MRSFKQYTMAEFNRFMKDLPNLTRKVSNIQIHHTWKPNKADYQGEQTIRSMWNYHANEKGWGDIAQHFSIAPDGTIWDGRPLEQDPAGIAGHNNGSIMIEMIGNFDQGHDVLQGEQLQAVVVAVRAIMDRFGLTTNDIVFHRQYSQKSCPGSGLSKTWLINQIIGQQQKVKAVVKQKPVTAAEPAWKIEAVNWLYDQQLLRSDEWKTNVNQPFPLWAQAIMYRRIFDQVNGISEPAPTSTANWKLEAVNWMYEQGLLNVADWKKQIEAPLPVWAEAVVLKRLMNKLNR